MLFARISYKHPNIEKPIEYGWCLKLTTLQDVMDFITEKDWVPEKAFADYVETVRSKVVDKEKRHLIDPVASVVEGLAINKGISFLNSLSDMNMKRANAMLTHYPLYVQRIGSWLPITKDITEHETRESNCFPEDEDKKPRYLQWGGGKHWYVKVGDIDVVVNDRQKWDTRKEAEEAYEKWKDWKNA